MALLLASSALAVSRDDRQILPPIQAEAAIVMDGNSGKILYALSPDKPYPPASTTKIVSGMLLALKMPPNASTVVSPYAAEMPGDRLGLRTGEQITAKNLLYAMLLVSANDAAEAAAEMVGGTEKGFVQQMNFLARQVGAHHTHFVNPSGLPAAAQYSTARDLALLARAALAIPAFARAVKTKTYLLHLNGGKRAKMLVNTNTLLWTFPGTDGVKTGYTREAGYCYVGSATRGGHQLIVVLLHCSNWQKEAVALFRYGFQKEGLNGVEAFAKGHPKATVSAKELTPNGRINAFNSASEGVAQPVPYGALPQKKENSQPAVVSKTSAAATPSLPKGQAQGLYGLPPKEVPTYAPPRLGARRPQYMPNVGVISHAIVGDARHSPSATVAPKGPIPQQPKTEIGERGRWEPRGGLISFEERLWIVLFGVPLGATGAAVIFLKMKRLLKRRWGWDMRWWAFLGKRRSKEREAAEKNQPIVLPMVKVEANRRDFVWQGPPLERRSVEEWFKLLYEKPMRLLEPTIRWHARAILEVNPELERGRLRAELNSQESPRIRLAVADVVGAVAPREVERVLRQILDKEGLALDIRMEASDLLVRYGGNRCEAYWLEKLLKEGAPWAAKSLASLPWLDNTTAQALLQALQIPVASDAEPELAARRALQNAYIAGVLRVHELLEEDAFSESLAKIPEEARDGLLEALFWPKRTPMSVKMLWKAFLRNSSYSVVYGLYESPLDLVEEEIVAQESLGAAQKTRVKALRWLLWGEGAREDIKRLADAGDDMAGHVLQLRRIAEWNPFSYPADVLLVAAQIVSCRLGYLLYEPEYVSQILRRGLSEEEGEVLPSGVPEELAALVAAYRNPAVHECVFAAMQSQENLMALLSALAEHVEKEERYLQEIVFWCNKMPSEGRYSMVTQLRRCVHSHALLALQAALHDRNTYVSSVARWGYLEGNRGALQLAEGKSAGLRLGEEAAGHGERAEQNEGSTVEEAA